MYIKEKLMYLANVFAVFNKIDEQGLQDGWDWDG